MKLTDDPNLSNKIESNRTKYFRKVAINSGDVVSAQIIHGNQVCLATLENRDGVVSEADGLVSNSKNIYLSVTAADCLPIFLFEPKKEIAGMIHAGWKSLAKNILINAILKMKELGGSPEKIMAGIGPAICGKHFEVGPEVAEKFTKYPEVIIKENDKLFLDIKKTAKLQLVESGLKENNIEISQECTFELPEKYFSARRDKPEEIEAMLAVIGMKNI